MSNSPRALRRGAAGRHLGDALRWMIAALLPVQPSLAQKSLHMVQATPAAAFVDSIGIQTHINYVDTPYAQWNRVRSELVRLGVRHVRDALPMSSTFVPNHRQFAAAGIRCTCGVKAAEGLTPDAIVRAARAATDVEAIEAPNECDAGTNCGGGGARGIARATAMLPALASAAHDLQVPLIGPSFTRAEAYQSTGSIAQWVAFNNLHVYFGGRNPGTDGWGAGDAEGHRYGSFDWWIDQSKVNAPGAPSLITETGYEAFDRPQRAGTIPLDVEATYLVRTLFLAWNHGIPRTFIYELLDEFPGSGYGLLRHDLSEKPAYTALRNLILLLRDSSADFTARSVGLTLVGGDSSLCHTLLQKSDGSYVLILWLEKPGYDTVAQRKIEVPAQSVQVLLENHFGVKHVIAFKDDGTTSDEAVTGAPSSFTIHVNDRLSVLRLVSRPKAATTLRTPLYRNQRLPS